jgi:transposase-like protein
VMPTKATVRRPPCPRCEKSEVKLTQLRGDSASYRCEFCGKRFRVAFDGR